MLRDRHRRPNRDVERDRAARRSERSPSTVRPVAEGRFEVGDIGVLPDTNPIITSVHRRRSGREGRAEGGRHRPGRERRADGDADAAHRRRFRSNGGKTIELTVRRDGERAVPVDGDAGAARRARHGSASYLSEPTKSFTPGPFEAIQLSVEHNIESSAD